MHEVYIVAGGNINNTLQKYKQLLQYLQQRIGNISRMSSYYTSPPWGYASVHPYVNVAIKISTDMDAHEVLTQCLTIEQLMGRTPHPKDHYTDRTMDIDIILYDDAIIQDADLEIPHPRMHMRNFVLTPLCEIDACKVHPILGKTIAELKAVCPDTAEVKPIELI